MKKNNLQKSVNNLSIQNDCKKLIALVMMIKNEERKLSFFISLLLAPIPCYDY